MKKIISGILVSIGLLTNTSCTKIDNYPGPNSSFEGRFIDATTGENFITTQGSIQVRLEQISWSETPSPQDIPSKFDGTFKDTRLFKGKYRVTPRNGAFWPDDAEPIELDIQSGTKHDFQLTPYLAINAIDHEIDEEGNLVLRFTLEAPLDEPGIPKILDIQPYVNITKLVGPGASLPNQYTDALRQNVGKFWDEMNDGEKSFEIKIPGLPGGRKIYARVGVRFDDNSKSSNFSKILEIDIPANDQ